jgi:hypothetical protein
MSGAPALQEEQTMGSQPSALQQYIVAAATLVIGLLAGYLKAFMGTYGGKRGELQAMHEGIDKLLEQVNVVQRRQEEMKAEILDAVWERQTRWTVKKEILFEVLREVGSVSASLTNMVGTYQAARKEEATNPAQQQKMAEMRGHVVTEFAAALSKLGAVRTLCGVVASGRVQERLYSLQHKFGELGLKSGTVDTTDVDHTALSDQIKGVIAAIKDDLGLEASQGGLAHPLKTGGAPPLR